MSVVFLLSYDNTYVILVTQTGNGDNFYALY